MIGHSARPPAVSAALQSTWTNSPWFRRALAVAAGALLALAFPRPNVAGLAWVAPALLLLATRSGNAFRLGCLAGFTHYLISLSWLLNIPVRFFPILGWIALAAYLALYPGLWAWLCGQVRAAQGEERSWTARTGCALFCATAWVAMEMAGSRMFSGFPWNLLGTSQQKLTPLIQIAAWTGVYGVSFLVVWFSASLLNALEALLARPTARNVWLKELALPIFVAAVLYAFGFHRIASDPKPARQLRIALVQPNIPQTMVWDPAAADVRFAELLRLTTDALTNKPDVVIWPEAAVPKMVRDDEATARTITQLARSNRVWFIIGSDDFGFRGTNALYFNSSFLISPSGQFAATYRKRRLVIFGEYVPLADSIPLIKHLTPISGGFTAGTEPVPFDLVNLAVKTSVLICFEDVFPHYAREHATEDIDFLVNITNDGWFGEGSAQWQQAASAAFRAVENGLPLVRCANNGLTCWIDHFGVINNTFFDDSTDVYRAGFKIVTVRFHAASKTLRRTFYAHHGDWFGWGCVAITIVVGAVRIPLRRRR